ncbi:MAG: GNAT family N-acetyltransferase [Planctomycetota bacterium]|nr:MAG: GNAT family N-acetyltransferase [Planctomycetota bacterium]
MSGAAKLTTKDGRGIIIRDGKAADGVGIVNIYRTVGAEKIHITLEDYPFHEYTESRFIKALLKSGSYLAVAEHEKRIVGYCRLERHLAPKREHTAEIAMAILKDYRNIGIGTALTKAGIEWAKTTDLHKLHLSVFATNTAAIALYKKLAFVEEGRRKEQICIDGQYIDEILMGFYLRDKLTREQGNKE